MRGPALDGVTGALGSDDPRPVGVGESAPYVCQSCNTLRKNSSNRPRFNARLVA